ncbi:ATP-dependent DNA helicase RecG [Treponema bryantii]|uniref:ATP-dependent DNA helicase RecG n=1 Tax=Treponema bryantii TaxID=163 RepID=UPI0003B440C8|nr:ATP-dependent DNA helicase RecG [Treponema bryantii]
MKVSEIKTPVSSIAGIGPQLTKTLAKVNVFTVGDLLQYYPRDYEDRTRKVCFREQAANYGKVHTVARVLAHEWFGYGRMKTLKIIVNDGSGTAELICFNRAFLEKSLVPGTIITVTGKFEVKYGKLQSTAFEVIKHTEIPVVECPSQDLSSIPPKESGIIPVYPLTEGLTQKAVTKAVSQALQQYALGIEDELPAELIKERALLSKQEALRFIHRPTEMSQVAAARRTLVYEELFQFQKIIAERVYKRKGHTVVECSRSERIETTAELNKSTGSQSGFDTASGLLNHPIIDISNFTDSLSPLQLDFFNSLPFPLTDDQRKVIYEMDAEIDRSYTERERVLNQLDRGMPPPTTPTFTMARLLQGDVGSGKTLVSLFVCLRIISWKGQCAFMAPTEILARQHAETTARLLAPLGVRTAFLTGNLKAKGRNQLLKALKEGEIDIIVGTHALFSSNVEYKDMELAVIDEQHRFGVLQRQAIIEKGRQTVGGYTFEPNLLMMSATPIPQSLALTVFGDLDISSIHTMPAGRKPITTYLVKEGNEINAYEAVRKELAKGHQAYFVYPAIDSDENIKSAERIFAHLRDHIYPQYKCALVHSKIDEEEQVNILRAFRDGTIQVLAATTVIEVGVDVPNATCMVIEGADRFGMAQLHQLRGRVGRGDAQSYCFLIYSKDITETGIERMKALRQSTDGFFIAEQDLKTRGPGELNGTVQAGELGFRIADLSRDMEIMEQARNDAISCTSSQSASK